MVTQEAIRELSDRIVREFHPERIILFGSYAYGTPNEDSDVDLLIVMPFEGSQTKKASEIRLAVHPGFPIDLIVRTPETLQQRLAQEDFFLREITEKGKLLYEAPHHGVDRES